MTVISEEQRAAGRQKRLTLVHELGLSMQAEFLPWSTTKDLPKRFFPDPLVGRELNWKFTFLKDGKEFLSISRGSDVCDFPSYPPEAIMDGQLTEAQVEILQEEAETGHTRAGEVINPPCLLAVLLSLCLEMLQPLEFDTYEKWELSFDRDSTSNRSEWAYERCKSTLRAFRSVLSEEDLERLFVAFELDRFGSASLAAWKPSR
jgi:hypothetical protein